MILLHVKLWAGAIWRWGLKPAERGGTNGKKRANGLLTESDYAH